MFYVYELIRDGERFYIGQTANPDERLANHKAKFGPSVSMNVLSSFSCRMEAKWEERRLCDELFGTANYRSNVCSEILYPRSHGTALASKMDFVSRHIKHSGMLPNLVTFGWSHWGYPTSPVPTRSKASKPIQ